MAPRVWSEIGDKSGMGLGFILRFGAQGANLERGQSIWRAGTWFGGRRMGGLVGNGEREVELGTEEHGIETRKKHCFFRCGL